MYVEASLFICSFGHTLCLASLPGMIDTSKPTLHYDKNKLKRNAQRRAANTPRIGTTQAFTCIAHDGSHLKHGRGPYASSSSSPSSPLPFVALHSANRISRRLKIAAPVSSSIISTSFLRLQASLCALLVEPSCFSLHPGHP